MVYHDPAHVLTARPVPDIAYTPQRRDALIQDVLARVSSMKGVTHVGFATFPPLTPGDALTAFQMALGPSREQRSVQATVQVVSRDYFGAIGMRVLEGRGFAKEDDPASAPVVLVNQTFANRYLAGSALGQRFDAPLLSGHGEAWIVGVVRDVRRHSMTEPVAPEIFVAMEQTADRLGYDQPMLVIRTEGSPAALIPASRSLVREIDSTLALESMMTMEDRLTESLAKPRLCAVLLAVFALTALTIAAVGLFGVLAFGVAQRSREIGVRMVLGARPREIVKLVTRQAAAISAVGVTFGLGLSLTLVRFIARFLYGVRTHDVATFIAVPGLLLGIAALACWLPARRAARIDPLKALRM